MLRSSLVPTLRKEGYKIYPTDINASDREIEFLDVRDIGLWLRQLQSYCREYALANFSEKNAELIVGSYYG